MIRIILFALLGLSGTWQAAQAASPIWQDEFNEGKPIAGEWSSCAQPWETTVGRCSSLVAGAGQQTFGDAPVPLKAFGQIRLNARPKTAADRKIEGARIAAQKPPAEHASATTKADWRGTWMQTRRSFGLGTMVEALFLPGNSLASWSGLWLLNDPGPPPSYPNRKWPPEFDVGEVTLNKDGSMYVRFALHYLDAKGKKQTDNCSQTLSKRQWVRTGLSRAEDGSSYTFWLNGKAICTKPLPASARDPMQIILSQQVGGLAAAPGASTEPFGTQVDHVRVTVAR